MYLRINKGAAVPGSKDRAIEIWQGLMPRVMESPGCRGIFVLGNEEKDMGGSITLWEDKESCERSFTSDMRRDVIKALEPTIAGDVEAEMYEVIATGREFVEAEIRAGYLAYNDRDWDKLTANATDDVEVVDVPNGITGRGKEAVLGFTQGWAAGFPDSTIEIVNLAVVGTTAVVEYKGTGTHTGALRTPAGDIPPTGRRVELSVCEVHTLRNGKTTRLRIYYDIASLMTQLGLMPSMETAGASV